MRRDFPGQNYSEPIENRITVAFLWKDHCCTVEPRFNEMPRDWGNCSLYRGFVKSKTSIKSKCRCFYMFV